ncbi:MAG: hypothetical protein FVQ81_01460 [Candidatus Glassbacteria bacterium]|nr:hypothetical protein [Candidatus Glassbacteria bacterium]
MNGKPTKALLFRESLNQGLAEKVAGLDRDHYPESLIEIMEAVLLDQGCPRGLPLLAAGLIKSGPDAGEKPQAAEVLWQGLIMTALLAQEEPPVDGLAAGLTERFDSAHLLLAADTMLTWPFEFLTGGLTEPDSSAEMAAACRSALAGLAAADGGFAGLCQWEPLIIMLEPLCRGRDLRTVSGLRELAGAAYLADLSRWLARPDWLAKACDQATSGAGRADLSGGLAEVRALLFE